MKIQHHLVASEYLYPHPASSCRPIPYPTLSAVASEYLYPPPCQQLPANTFTPTLSAVFLSFPRFWRTRERLCMNRVKSSWHVARMQFISVFLVISHPSHLCYHISFLLTVSLFILLQEKFLQFDCLEQQYFSII